ncbi:MULTISPECIES: DNA-binding protein [Bacillus]|nr:MULTISPECIES: DNA-binding protein [Bacillus]MBP1080291.1 hypothetical protein [Bacillus capparidis]MED1094154.1 DNA-binding protein [Bacillus capparidis]
MDEVLTRQEAEMYLNMKKQSFPRSLKKEKIRPFKTSGKTQLFLKSDLRPYKEELETELKKYNPNHDE